MGSMSVTEILDELAKLTPEELGRIQDRIPELEGDLNIDESPELLAAIDEGLRSEQNEPTYTVDEASVKIAVDYKLIPAPVALSELGL